MSKEAFDSIMRGLKEVKGSKKLVRCPGGHYGDRNMCSCCHGEGYVTQEARNKWVSDWGLRHDPPLNPKQAELALQGGAPDLSVFADDWETCKALIDNYCDELQVDPFWRGDPYPVRLKRIIEHHRFLREKNRERMEEDFEREKEFVGGAR